MGSSDRDAHEERPCDKTAKARMQDMLLDMANIGLWRALQEGRVIVHDDNPRE